MILVDAAIWRWRGRRWAHLVSDESHEELHAFAARLGLRRVWFQGDHYDIPAEVREQALRLGAVAVDSRDLVVRLSAAGLRKRRTAAPLVNPAGQAHAAAGNPAVPGSTARAGAAAEVDAVDERYAPGLPSWVDLATTDPEAAMAFYGSLFGWEFDVGGPEMGRYTFCRLRGRAVAGLNGRPAPEGWPPSWTTYFADDAEAAAQRITAAGGTVRLGPADAGSFGRVVVARDPAGAVFGVWQAGTHPGSEIVNEPGTMSWSELATADVDAAQAFYGAVFPYAFGDVPAGDGATSYRVVTVDDRPVAGMTAPGARVPSELAPAWLPYFAVRDTDETAAAAARLGATSPVPPAETRFGRWAVLADPQGAVFVVVANPSTTDSG